MQRIWIKHGPEGGLDNAIHALITVVRLVLVVVAGVFVFAATAVATTATSVGALWFFIVGMAGVGAWILWDVAKSWGLVPAARLRIDRTQIAFSTPLWGRTFTSTTLCVGEPIALATHEYWVIPAGKNMHVFEFRQGDTAVRYLAPAPMSERSAAKLREALASVDSPLHTDRSPAPRRRARRRAGRSLDS